MNRTIKFRVWDKDAKRMHEPSLNMLIDSHSGSAHWQFGFSTPQPIGGDVVVMQFTGLLDKDGKEIYEGDIVDYLYNNSSCIEQFIHRGVVNYSDDNCCYLIGNDHIHEDLDITVLGNIHNTRELLSI